LRGAVCVPWGCWQWVRRGPQESQID
jgi:hypothetical protein